MSASASIGPKPLCPRGSRLDPDDTMFLRCAEAARTEHLVTGNKRQVPQAACGTVQVISAGEPLDRITLEI